MNDGLDDFGRKYLKATAAKPTDLLAEGLDTCATERQGRHSQPRKVNGQYPRPYATQSTAAFVLTGCNASDSG